jgi:hypothetical protein
MLVGANRQREIGQSGETWPRNSYESAPQELIMSTGLVEIDFQETTKSIAILKNRFKNHLNVNRNEPNHKFFI